MHRFYHGPSSGWKQKEEITYLPDVDVDHRLTRSSVKPPVSAGAYIGDSKIRFLEMDLFNLGGYEYYQIAYSTAMHQPVIGSMVRWATEPGSSILQLAVFEDQMVPLGLSQEALEGIEIEVRRYPHGLHGSGEERWIYLVNLDADKKVKIQNYMKTTHDKEFLDENWYAVRHTHGRKLYSDKEMRDMDTTFSV